MHAANIKKSPRLQRVGQLLSDGQPHSTLDICHKCNVMSVNSIIAELRTNGRIIDCSREGNYWYYTRTNIQKQTTEAEK